MPHLGAAERVGLPGEVDRHPHPTGAGSLEAVAADAQADTRGEGGAGIGVEVEDLEPHATVVVATLVVEHAGVARGEPPGERSAMNRRRATVLIPIARPRAKRHRPEGLARTPRRAALEEGEMEGILVGPPSFLPFEERDLSVDPPTLGKQASGEENEQADVGDHEPGLMSFPGVADRRRTKNAHRQEGIEEREPPSVPDAKLHRLGAVSTLDKGSQPQNDRQEGDEDDREPERGEELVDGEHDPHGGRLIGRGEPACSHGMESRGREGLGTAWRL